MRVGPPPLTLPLPSTVERDPKVTRAPAPERDATKHDDTTEQTRRTEPRRRSSQRIDTADRTSTPKFSRVKDINELPANSRLAIATYSSTQRLAKDSGAGQLAGIDEIV